jgi:hypothetical protein
VALASPDLSSEAGVAFVSLESSKFGDSSEEGSSEGRPSLSVGGFVAASTSEDARAGSSASEETAGVVASSVSALLDGSGERSLSAGGGGVGEAVLIFKRWGMASNSISVRSIPVKVFSGKTSTCS